MIIIRMSGGLGNQMFQYALYRKLVSLGRQVSFDDTTEYTSRRGAADQVGNERPIALPVFGIHYKVCTREDLIRQTDSDMHLSSRIRRRITGRRSLERHDEDFVFDPAFLEQEEGYYTGCFQSPLYFRGVEEDLRKEFSFPEDILTAGRETGCSGISPLTEEEAARNQRCREQILGAGRSCAIHLRFGDYLTKSDVYGGITTEAYYQAGVSLLTDRQENAGNGPISFFLFSNDADRAETWRQAQPDPDRFTVVRGNDEAHGYVDLYLMSLCDDFIIANSSFSFWGAWLGRTADKRVIAPTCWINDEEGKSLRRTDIFPEDWVRVSPRGERLPETEWEIHGRRPRFGGSGDTPAPATDTGHVSGSVSEQPPTVSVIVAAYNIESFIQRALRSLQRQTFRDMEFIVVDDGSTDRTGQICDAFAAEDARFRVIHQPNGGLSAARNAGLAVARGAWIGYLDGDDAAEPWMYESLLSAGMMAGADVALCGYREVQDIQREDPGHARTEELRTGTGHIIPEGMTAEAAAAVRKSTMLTRGQALDIYVRSGVVDEPGGINFYNSVWSKLFRRSAVEDLRFPVGKNSEDILYTTKALLRSERCVYLPSALYLYTCGRRGSIMNVAVGERRLHDEIPFYEEQIRLFREAGLTETARKASFYLARRMLFYWDDFDQAEDAETRSYAPQLEQLLMEHRSELVPLLRNSAYGRRGDRARLRLFLYSPSLYRKMRKL